MLAMNSRQWGGVFVCIGGIYLTLIAYGFIHQSNAVDTSSVKNRLRWAGPFTFVVGLGEIILNGSP